VALPSSDVDVASAAARADRILINRNRQPENGFDRPGWLNGFRKQTRKPLVEMLGESGFNFAVRVVTT